MKNTDYAYAVSNIRADENSLLTKAFIDSLISAESYEKAIQLLLDRGLSFFEKPLGDALGDYMESAWDRLKEAAPDEKELYFLIAENDFHNLKAIIKGLAADKNGLLYTLKPSVTKPEEILAAVKEKAFDSLPFPLSKAAEEGYRILTSTGDGQLFDMFIDKSAYEAMIYLAGENSFTETLAEEITAQVNIKTAYRLADFNLNSALLDYAYASCRTLDTDALKKAAGRGSDAVKAYLQSTDYAELCEFDSPAALEVSCDRRIKEMLDNARLISFGIEPLTAYYYAKKTECGNLRLILTAKQSELSENIIRERLRDLYV